MERGKRQKGRRGGEREETEREREKWRRGGGGK
jgi:hypothetical protein